jgi:hypothetical protein
MWGYEIYDLRFTIADCRLPIDHFSELYGSNYGVNQCKFVSIRPFDYWSVT